MCPITTSKINVSRNRYGIVRALLLICLSLMAVLLCSTGLFSEALAVDVPRTLISHEQIFTFLVGYPLPLKVVVDDPKGVAEVRCYFRFDQSLPYVYTEMVPVEEHSFMVTLPSTTVNTKSVEFLFLVLNKEKQVIVSSTYNVQFTSESPNNERGCEAEKRQQINYHFKSEVRDVAGVKEHFVESAKIIFSSVHQQEQYGALAGLFTKEQLDASSVTGYFGAFRLDQHNDIVAVQGSIVTRDLLGELESGSKSSDIRGIGKSDPMSVPQVAGVTWKGFFWRSDDYAGTVQPVTATVSQDKNAKIHIETNLDGLGQSFDGEIYSTGHLLLTDSFDQEVWSTHDGPVTELYIKIEDYVVPPAEMCDRPDECTRPEYCSDPDATQYLEECYAPLPDVCYEPLPDECVNWPLNIIELTRATNEKVPSGALFLLLSSDKSE